jgi:NADP-dependent aldehyde dehydrogenase
MPTLDVRPVLVGGEWRSTHEGERFISRNPVDGAPLGEYPVSPWSEVSEALEHAFAAYRELESLGIDHGADFLDCYADGVASAAAALVETAHQETALPAAPRLAEVELPRTIDQLRQAAQAARTRSWVLPTISTTAGIASYLAPIPGAVAVFGPNNFPFAFNSASGGDFAAAIATGHPVIAKANPGHPETTRLLASAALAASEQTGLPASTVQLIYRTSHDTGRRLVADPRLAASAYTGSRAGGMDLKTAADRAGKPIYLEMSSVNPIILLSGALRQRAEAIAEEFCASMLLGVGQFCTSPGILFVPGGSAGDRFVDEVGARLESAPVGTLLDDGVRKGLQEARDRWEAAGAAVIAVADTVSASCRYPNTLMQASSADFAASNGALQSEAFGNMALVVRYSDIDELNKTLELLEGNLTGSVYSDENGGDDPVYEAIVPRLRERVGRLLNDKMPTGVDVVPAMNHGGPFPSTGHPGFTAVGIPASLRRFGALQCFDNVRPYRLPPELQPENPLGLQRYVDGSWTEASTMPPMAG